MRKRLTKQLIVVGILASVFLGMGSLVWVATRPPPPTPTPSAPSYAPLEVRGVRILSAGDGYADLYALVRNPNASAGIRSVDFSFTLRGGGAALDTITGNTFFLPGQEKPLVLAHQVVPTGVTAADLTFGTPEWVPVSAGFREPSLVPVSREVHIREGVPATYELKGLLANQSSLDYLRVDVTGVGYDERGEVVGVGKTFLGSLLSGERREFLMLWPLPAGSVVREARIFAEVNVFSASAIQPKGGVSGLEPLPTPSPSASPFQ